MNTFHAPTAFGASPSEGEALEVGALLRLTVQALAEGVGFVQVRGEVSGFMRAASGHCYFTLKDSRGDGQIKCVMFRRAAEQLRMQSGALPRDGDLLEVGGKLSLYEARGDLQLIVEHAQATGAGALFAEFLRLKGVMQSRGWFDAARKRPIAAYPRSIGLVTSLGAAALHDVATALARRCPHVAVVLAPTLVQGREAPEQIAAALQALNDFSAAQPLNKRLSHILLVRGGGSLEDLWAFNTEAVAQAVVGSALPVICGVGHETDFSLADFCADLRAPTPTAAAELAATPHAQALAEVDGAAEALDDALDGYWAAQGQHLDAAQDTLTQVAQGLQQQARDLNDCAARLKTAAQQTLTQRQQRCSQHHSRLHHAQALAQQRLQHQLAQQHTRLAALSPHAVLQRGYALVSDAATGAVIKNAASAEQKKSLTLQFVDRSLAVEVADRSSGSGWRIKQTA